MNTIKLDTAQGTGYIYLDTNTLRFVEPDAMHEIIDNYITMGIFIRSKKIRLSASAELITEFITRLSGQCEDLTTYFKSFDNWS